MSDSEKRKDCSEMINPAPTIPALDGWRFWRHRARHWIGFAPCHVIGTAAHFALKVQCDICGDEWWIEQ